MIVELIPFPEMRIALGLPDRFPIDGDHIELGRSRECGIHLNVNSVSRRHAVIDRSNGSWQIENHSDSNPVHVNGVVGDRLDLHNGDTVQIGEILFLFEFHDPASDSTHIVERDYDTPLTHDDDGVLPGLVHFFEDLENLGRETDLHRHLESLVRRALPCDEVLALEVEGSDLIHPGADRYTATLIQRCRITGRSILWRAGVDDPSISAGGFGIHSAICSPVGRVEEEPFAYLYMHRIAGAPLTEDDLELVRALSRLAGIMIESRRLREQQASEIIELRETEETQLQMKFFGRAMQALLREARTLASSDSPILIRGATGTGKEVLARFVRDASLCPDGPFVAVNCAAIPENLLESELFGYAPNSGIANADPRGRRGRFELAQHGTLLLDEIGDMPLPLQGKLLRVLDSGQVEPLGSEESIDLEVRILCATHQDLELLVREGRFREDLYHRVRRVQIVVPPLAERADEIEPLACHFARHFFQLRSKSPLPDPLISDQTIARLSRYEWPGNVRELRNVIEEAVLRSGGQTIERRHMRGSTLDDATTKIRSPLETLEVIESEHITKVLQFTGGNRKVTAEILGIHRNTLTQKIKRYGLGAADGDGSAH